MELIFQWSSDVNALAGRFNTATPGVDIFIVTPPENQRTNNPIAIAAYAQAARARAWSTPFAYLDLQLTFGVSGDPTEYGSAGIVPLFNSDLLHPADLTGGRLILAEILRVVEP